MSCGHAHPAAGRRRVLQVLAVVIVLLSACFEDDAGSRAREETPPAASLNAVGECRGVSASPTPGSATLAGDVDGDGRDDEVWLAFEPRAAAACRAALVVRTASGVATAPVVQPGMSVLPETGFPGLRMLLEADGAPGAEIVVDLIAGASTQFAALFSWEDGRLSRVELKGDVPEAEDLFPYGGSVGHMEASDCAGRGTVVISVAVPQGRRYEVERTFFRFDGERFVVDRAASEKRVVGAASVQELPEYAASPFGSCPAG